IVGSWFIRCGMSGMRVAVAALNLDQLIGFAGSASVQLAMIKREKQDVLGLISFLVALGLSGPSVSAATTSYATTGSGASDTNLGTEQQPVRNVAKAVSLAKPGDTVLFAAGDYPCSGVTIPNGSEDLPIILRSEGNGKVIFSNDGARTILRAGFYNTIDGIEFQMNSDQPKGAGISLERKEHVIVRNCRFFACQVGVSATSAHYLTIKNCEMAYLGAHG